MTSSFGVVTKVYSRWCLLALLIGACTPKKSKLNSQNIDGTCWKVSVLTSKNSSALEVLTNDYYKNSLAVVMLCRTGRLGPRYGKNCDVTAAPIDKNECSGSDVATLISATTSNNPGERINFTNQLIAYQPQDQSNKSLGGFLFEYPSGNSLSRDSLCMSFGYEGSAGKVTIDALSREESEKKKLETCNGCSLTSLKIFLKEKCVSEGS